MKLGAQLGMRTLVVPPQDRVDGSARWLRHVHVPGRARIDLVQKFVG